MLYGEINLFATHSPSQLTEKNIKDYIVNPIVQQKFFSCLIINCLQLNEPNQPGQRRLGLPMYAFYVLSNARASPDQAGVSDWEGWLVTMHVIGKCSLSAWKPEISSGKMPKKPGRVTQICNPTQLLRRQKQKDHKLESSLSNLMRLRLQKNFF